MAMIAPNEHPFSQRSGHGDDLRQCRAIVLYRSCSNGLHPRSAIVLQNSESCLVEQTSIEGNSK